MAILLQRVELGVILLSAFYGLTVVALVMLLYRILQPRLGLRGLGVPYTVGTLALGLAVGLTALMSRIGRPLDSGLQRVLEGILLCSWGFVGLALVETLLIERWLAPYGVKVPRLVRDIARALTLLIAILLAVRLVFQIPLSSIVISSTVLSAVIGLALQDLLKNVFAGIALQIEQPFEVGHWVEINRQTSRVVEMSWRATRVITVDGNYIIYPNSMLAQAELVNYTLGSPVQALHVQVSIGQSYPPSRIKHVLIEAALAAPDVLSEPRPSVKVVQYGEFQLVYDVKFWLANFDRYPEKRDAVMTNIWYFLNRAGIPLPTPIRNVYLHALDDQSEEQARRAALEHIVKHLRGVDLFMVLDDDELRQLGSGVQTRLYGRGEMLVRQGAPGTSFFIVCSGRVRVEVSDAEFSGPALTVNHLGQGEFFGEMALLTGEPRGATVVAEEDTEVLVVPQAALAPLLQRNADLPERLGEVLVLRMRMNQSALQAQREVGMPADEEISRPTLARRIRSLFGLTHHYDAQQSM